MVKSYKMELAVGTFMAIAFVAIAILVIQVSGLSSYQYNKNSYQVVIKFTNIGSLKSRAKVTIGGVVVGRVISISLDPKTYNAKVLIIMKKELRIPEDTTASILTSGLLGDNYISLTPGFSHISLKEDSIIPVENTYSVLILEHLIDKFIAN